jgi:hypothetical protein
VFLVAMLVAALVPLARDNTREPYQRAMLVIVGCAWFIGFLPLGLCGAVEGVLKPTDPGWGSAKVFTALKEFSDCFR